MTSSLLALLFIAAATAADSGKSKPYTPDNADFAALRTLSKSAKCDGKPESIQPLLDRQAYDEALACALDAVEGQPMRSTSYALLGYALASRGDSKSMLLAANQFAKAIKLAPKDLMLSLNLGHCFHHAGLPLKAVKAYRREFSLDGRSSTFLVMMQEYSKIDFDSEEAEQIVKLATASFNLTEATLLARPPAVPANFSELLPESDESMLAAVPLYGEPPRLLGRANITAERAMAVVRGSRMVVAHAGATSLFSAALSLAYATGSNRTIAQVTREIGLLSLERRDAEHAILWLRRSIFADPRYTGTYNNLGGVLRITGNVREARMALEAGLRRCSERLDELYQGLSFVAKDEGNVTAARALMMEAISRNPMAQYWASYAALFDDTETDERITAYNNALQVQPDAILAFCNRAELYAGAAMWDELARDLPRLQETMERALSGADATSMIGEPCLQPFHSTYMPIEPALQRRVAESFALRESVAQPLAPLAAVPLAGRKMSIGYMSADFGNHPLGRFVQALFAAHDRTKFRVHCISLEAHDGDATNAVIRKGCDEWIELPVTTPHNDAAVEIRALELDVLVDLNGWTKGRRPRILAYRPAAVQMLHAWGYIGTSGASFIDYFISDHVVSPATHEPFHSEKLIRLPHTYFPVSHRVAHPAATLDAIDRAALRTQLGMPRDAVIVANFQSVTKISAAAFDSWCRVVSSQPDAVLWMLRPTANATAERLHARCATHGLPRERLVFGTSMEPDSHIKRLLVADLFLDSDLYGAHSTGADALWAGVPLLTFAGDKLCSRVGASMLHSMGLADELLVENRAAFEAKARALIGNRAELARLRSAVLSKRATSPLFDIDLYARGLEAAYTRAYELYAAGEATEAISIEASGNTKDEL